MAKKIETPKMSEADLAAALMGKKKVAAAEVVAPVLERKLASRAGWTGTLSFGLVTVGVKTYTATEKNALNFNNLHTCGGRMNRKDYCATCEAKIQAWAMLSDSERAAKEAAGEVAPVDCTSKQKGYEYTKGSYITVTGEELEACEPTSDKVMTLSEFVPASQVDPIYFENTYFVSPSDEGAQRTFGLLCAAMRRQNKVGVITFVTRGRQNTAIIRPYTDENGTQGMTLHYMFYDSEIRDFNNWANVPSDFSDEEMDLAGQLIEMKSGDFTPKKFFDTYDANVRQLVASKITDTAAPVVAKAPAPVVTSNLMDALRASIAAAKSKVA